MDHSNSRNLPKTRLRETAVYFTQLGFTAFGGPAAHVALMERQLVEQRRWLDRRQFLDLISAINLIPGPNSTQLAISIGFLRAGIPGLFVAGICFILPAVLIILPIAWLYVLYGQTPHAAAALRGVNAAVLAIVAAAVVKLARAAITDRFTIGVAIVAAAAAGVGYLRHWTLADLVILFGAAGVGMLKTASGRVGETKRMAVVAPFPFLLAAAAAPAGLMLMALLFLKIGATLYGSGYLLLPYLRENFVTAHAWLSERQLLDAVAVGQVTPGPLLTTATFVGFLLGYRPEFAGGLGGAVAGALLATAAIFAPSFVFIALLGPVLPRIRNHPLARGALDAMNAAVVALIAVTLAGLAPPVVEGPRTWLAILIFGGTMLALLKWDVNPTWPLLAAAGVGALAVV